MNFAGIDVSKDTLDVHVVPDGARFKVTRAPAGLAELAAKLKPLAPQTVAMEATGGFEAMVAASLAAQGFQVAVVNPAQVRHYAQALGKRAKTDPIDAAVIAAFAEVTRPRIKALPDAETTALSELMSRRHQLVAMLTAERARQTRASSKQARQCKAAGAGLARPRE